MRSEGLAVGGSAAKHTIEEIAEVEFFAADTAAEIRFEIPAGWRREFIPGVPSVAEIVVGGALIRVAKHIVGFAYLLEPLLCIRLFADIGMKFSREPFVGTFNVGGAGIALNA